MEPGAIKTEFSDAMDQKFNANDNSPYKELKKTMAKVMKSAYEPGNYSEPSVIAETISKAIRSKNPRTRYASGKMARQTLMGRRWLSDKGFDKMIMRMIRNFSKNG